MLAAIDYIAQNYADSNLSVGQIAAQLDLSEGHLSHLFKKETDYTIGNYLTRYRIHKAMELLRQGRLKVYEVAEAVGYRDIAYFSATFKKVAGMAPRVSGFAGLILRIRLRRFLVSKGSDKLSAARWAALLHLLLMEAAFRTTASISA